jgi:DNA-binding LacI/PurR family transcriptional regulator
MKPLAAELIAALRKQRSAVESGYEVLIGFTGDSPERGKQCVSRMVDRTVQGVAVMMFGTDEQMLKALSARDLPLISVGPANSSRMGTSIEVDFYNGISEVIEHPARLGRRDIVFISGPLSVPSAARARKLSTKQILSGLQIYSRGRLLPFRTLCVDL